MTEQKLTPWICANCRLPCYEHHWRIEYMLSIVDMRSGPAAARYQEFEPERQRLMVKARICSPQCLKEFREKYQELSVIEELGKEA